MNDPSENEPRKIIIDEDWKTQVDRERKEQREVPSASNAEAGEADNPVDMPPASFPLLVSNLATQALLYLGQFPNPIDNKFVVDLDLARHQIDTLAMLDAKTKGNLTDDESEQLQSVIQQLQMAFVALQSQKPT